MTTQTNVEVFTHGLVKVLKEQWRVDVWLKPSHNNDGDELIAAHKIILAARSKVFATMFESDKIKNWTVHETITLSDLKREELEVFVEFCYAGECMPSEKLKKHAMSLYRAADKYEIPYLRDLCRNHIMSSINASNAVEILELSRLPLDKTLSEFANNYIEFHSSMIFPFDSRRERDGLFNDPRGDRHRETPRDSSRSRQGERQRDEERSSSISSRIETERRGEIILDFVGEASRRAREAKTLSSSIDHGGIEESERDEERSSSIDHGAVEGKSVERRQCGRVGERETQDLCFVREREREKGTRSDERPTSVQ
ncbi:hypothetical protein F2Q70_00043949 [Brassica cretica]|uniref:BTB domain-containing protein n=1 Tax=Brassica cretica TaxID=69181 RepID=A0A8S9KFV6_BRACR|nr:hypothetical protein F2Q70_00043949 [Brassica cretica]KAF2609394.1 hypothetical protein F2Q68_00044952 [Brassica cretica]